MSTEAALQGSKLATYMNRPGPPAPQPGGQSQQNFHELNSKMSNLSVEHGMKMMGRPPTPG